MSRAVVTFQQFCSHQTKQTDFKVLQYHYNEYRKDHRELHIKAFMAEHDRDGWFLEKYDPMTIFEIKTDLKILS